MNIILKAARYAEEAHRGQVRKYKEVPYIIHPGRVAARLSINPYSSEELVAAAWLHDVLEDCGKTFEELDELFGPCVANKVYEVTNPSKQYPDMKREARKAIDRDHISRASTEAKMLKLADRADNLRDMIEADKDFKILYLGESTLLLPALAHTDAELEQEYREALRALEESICR